MGVSFGYGQLYTCWDRWEFLKIYFEICFLLAALYTIYTPSNRKKTETISVITIALSLKIE